MVSPMLSPMVDLLLSTVLASAIMTTWEQGEGAEEMPVLGHVFDGFECFHTHLDNDPEACQKCTRCLVWIRPSELNDRCPARAGQDRGLLH